MKMKFSLLIAGFIALVFAYSCEDKKKEAGEEEGGGKTVELTDDEYTNKWIHSQMKLVYLWNEELPKSPDYTKAPKTFFENILYKKGQVTGDRFSWIEEDTSKSKSTKIALRSELGFEFIPYHYLPARVVGTRTKLGFFVVSVDDGSSAATQGLKRGHVIYGVDGTEINYNNFYTILDNKSASKLSVYSENGQVTLPQIQASTNAKSPISISKVIETGGKKVGYLKYDQFIRSENDEKNNYEYDIALMDSIKRLNDQGISEFVLDLRYNPGGYLTSSMNLASALVPNRDIKKIFAKETYNKYFQDSIVKAYGADALNEYFLDKIYGTNIAIPRLNLGRIFILATDNSASASELVIHGLKPYMTVIHVGTTTVGKDKGSFTVSTNDKRVLWQLQPLVSRLTDANGVDNYIYGLEPTHEVNEWQEGYNCVDIEEVLDIPVLDTWKGGFTELGNPTEPLLAEALAKITGTPRVQKKKSVVYSDLKSADIPELKRDDRRFRTILDK